MVMGSKEQQRVTCHRKRPDWPFLFLCLVVVVVVVKFFNKNFVRRKVDNANIQTETDIKQSKQVQLHNTNRQNSDTTIKTKQAKYLLSSIRL